MNDQPNYRMYITKPAGVTSKEAIQLLGWDDRRTLKRYMIACNEFRKKVPTIKGNILIEIKAVEKPNIECSIPGCNRKNFSRNMCEMHYKQERRRNG